VRTRTLLARRRLWRRRVEHDALAGEID
jgi:hypothetical protein